MNILLKKPDQTIETANKPIYVFQVAQDNIDLDTVHSFGEEWSKFSHFDEAEIKKIGNDYFDILPESLMTKDTIVLDAGCGTGRWAAYLAPRVGFIECADPSDAVFVAADLLGNTDNVRISKVDIDSLPFADKSFDLVYSLGVLHHIPDTALAMKKCVQKVKPGGYFLVYLYYNLDNRGLLYKSLFHFSNLFRKIISRMPGKIKQLVCDGIALTTYWPLARFSGLTEKVGLENLSRKMPLSYYKDKSFWIMKNDALDRFGTPLEQRFSKKQITRMMEQSGLTNIIFSSKEPYWHAIGQRV